MFTRTTKSVAELGFALAFQRRKPMTIAATVFALLTAGAGASSGVAQQPRADTAPPITLPNTHEHVLHSRVNGKTYLIQVALPTAYVNARPGDLTRYPTFYLLGFGMLQLLYDQQQWDAFVSRRPTRTILVGVRPVDPRDWSFDYTPPLTAADSQYFKGGSSPMPGGAPMFGGAPQLLRVLKEEIIPLIDSSYPTSRDRGIEGVSMGGLFVAYAMLEEPDLFTRYAMISPSLWYPWGREKGMILAREPEFAKQHPTFQKTVYINVGSEDNSTMIAVAWRFVSQLCLSMSKGYYKGLDLGAETINGMLHGSPTAQVRALAAVYPDDSTRVKPGRGVMQDCH